jgi:aspartate 1-decarboxylase
MRRHLLKSKNHRATITSVELNDEGSLTLDEALLEAADMLPVEEVQAHDESEAQQHQPRVVLVERQNQVVRPPLRAES